MDKRPCVVPVAAKDALLWAEGRVWDVHLLLRAPLVPEAVYLLELPCLGAYREALKAILHWRRQGAVCMALRTVNPVVLSHVLKCGMVVTYKEPNGKLRLFAPPKAFLRWTDRLQRASSANSGAEGP